MASQIYTLIQGILKMDNRSKIFVTTNICRNRIPLFLHIKKTESTNSQLRLISSLGQLLFYRCVRTVTHHLRSVNFYFTVESEPLLDIFTKEEYYSSPLLYAILSKNINLFLIKMIMCHYLATILKST